MLRSQLFSLIYNSANDRYEHLREDFDKNISLIILAVGCSTMFSKELIFCEIGMLVIIMASLALIRAGISSE